MGSGVLLVEEVAQYFKGGGNSPSAEEAVFAYLCRVSPLSVCAFIPDFDINSINCDEIIGHPRRVGDLCSLYAERMGFNKDIRQTVCVAGWFHDIGKVAIDPSIFYKKEDLSDEEWHLIRKHPEYGSKILGGTISFNNLASFVLNHHERWDGKGYPQGLKKTRSSTQSRIIAVVDSFDAMVSDRPYSERRSVDSALSEILSCSGSQYDPMISRSFVKVINDFIKSPDLVSFFGWNT